jgi:4-amino-4-deoxy-L-arabinose transferase-like glycosyltransferase
MRRAWAAAALLLCTLWLAGVATRSVWTPDEPREFALSLSMQQQPGLAVPLLAGEPFLEKPPLTYWAAAATMALAGRNAVAARLPNLLYGMITVLAAAWLAAGLAPAALTRPTWRSRHWHWRRCGTRWQPGVCADAGPATRCFISRSDWRSWRAISSDCWRP